MVFYLLLVNKGDVFPCLTSNAPQLSASCHPLPPTASEGVAEDSDLNLKVKEHRRKMGYGLMDAPSAASQILLYQEKVDRHTHAVRTHLESVIRKALHHMRKDELWKRMLYGVTNSTEGKSVRMCVSVLCVCEYAV